MANTTNQITIPASTTGVLVQTIGKAALKTFGQAFVAALLVSVVPLLSDWQADLSGGGSIDMEDVNALGRLLFAAVIAGISAIISFGGNYFGAKTLPANTVVEAEVKP
jgi:uncharacterized membrane protein (DUF4010 family)